MLRLGTHFLGWVQRETKRTTTICCGGGHNPLFRFETPRGPRKSHFSSGVSRDPHTTKPQDSQNKCKNLYPPSTPPLPPPNPPEPPSSTPPLPPTPKEIRRTRPPFPRSRSVADQRSVLCFESEELGVDPDPQSPWSVNHVN